MHGFHTNDMLTRDKADLATSLMMAKVKRGRPSLGDVPRPKKRKSALATPAGLRTDSLDHLPLWNTTRSRCKYDKSSKIFCQVLQVPVIAVFQTKTEIAL